MEILIKSSKIKLSDYINFHIFKEKSKLYRINNII